MTLHQPHLYQSATIGLIGRTGAKVIACIGSKTLGGPAVPIHAKRVLKYLELPWRHHCNQRYTSRKPLSS